MQANFPVDPKLSQPECMLLAVLQGAEYSLKPELSQLSKQHRLVPGPLGAGDPSKYVNRLDLCMQALKLRKLQAKERRPDSDYSGII